MTESNWNNLQKILFAKYFTFEKGPALEIVHKNAKPIRRVWENLYNLLQTHLDFFDEDSKLLKIKKQSTQRRNLVIFKIMPHKYFVIDMNEERTINREEIQKLLDEDYFIFALGEDKQINLNEVDFYEINNEIVQKIMNLYYENSTIYLHGPNINVKVSEGRSTSSVNIKLDTGKVTLSFISEERSANHIFLNEDLVPIGTSNPTNNIEELKQIANRIKTIPIPESKIPKFITPNDELKLQKTFKND